MQDVNWPHKTFKQFEAEFPLFVSSHHFLSFEVGHKTRPLHTIFSEKSKP